MVRFFLLTVVASMLVSAAVAGKYNPVLSIGDKAPAWQGLENVDGSKHSLADMKQPVVVLVFTCNSCPYAVDYEARLKSLSAAIDQEKVAIVAVNVNKIEEDLPTAMKLRAQEQGFRFPYLFDGSQKIARDYGATYTPEFFVLDEDRKVVYMGAMDDSTDASKVTKHYVNDAIAAALQQKVPAVSETVAIGCRTRFERIRRRRKTSR